MYRSTSHCLDHALHFEREQDGRESSDGDVGLHTQRVHLLVVLPLQCVGHFAFFVGQVGEKFPFDTLFVRL